MEIFSRIFCIQENGYSDFGSLIYFCCLENFSENHKIVMKCQMLYDIMKMN